MGGWDRACGCVEEGQVEVSLKDVQSHGVYRETRRAMYVQGSAHCPS